MSAIAVRAPADVSKDEIWQKCLSLNRRMAKNKADEANLAEKFYDNGTIAVAAFGVGYLFTKFPAIEYIGPVPVQPVLGGVCLLFGMFADGFVAERASNVGVALLAPYLFEKGAELALP
jgi:hypothetical protein